MRLIDADELKKRAEEICFPVMPDCGNFYAVGVPDIDIMPTIDPESLRPTAHWASVKTDCLIQTKRSLFTTQKTRVHFLPVALKAILNAGMRLQENS